MRILIISPLFPPLADSEAICGGKFVQALTDSGVETSVIFASNVQTVPQFDGSRMWEPLRRVSIDVPNRSAPLLRRCLLGMRYQSTSWLDWTHRVVSKAKDLHHRMPFDLVISRSLPQQAHLAGYWVTSALGIPWVAIVNDPWDWSAFAATQAKRRECMPGVNDRIWWRRVVARADRLCFPCERLRDFCTGSARKSGLLITPHIGGAAGPARHSGEFVIVHAGKLGLPHPSPASANELERLSSTGRSPLALFQGLKELFRVRPAARSRTRLLLVGPQHKDTVEYLASQGLGELVTCTGTVTYEQSLTYIAQATVCALIEAPLKEGVFLPSKFCDYIAARKPVLALSPEVGTVADLVEDGVRRVNTNDSTGVAAAMVELFDAFLQSRLDSYSPSDRLVRRFEGDRVIDNFLTALMPLTGKQPRKREQHSSPSGGSLTRTRK